MNEPTPDELADWSERHCRLMGIAFDSDKQCVDEWTTEFLRMGYSTAEIHAATTAMAALTQPVKLTAQLAWINNHVTTQRALAQMNLPREKSEEHPDSPALFRKLMIEHGWRKQEPEKKKRKPKELAAHILQQGSKP